MDQDCPEGPQGRFSYNPLHDIRAQDKALKTPLEHTPQLQQELQTSWQNASLKLIESGAPGLTVFEAMLVVGLAGLVQVEGKLAVAQRLTQIAAQLAEQLAHE